MPAAVAVAASGGRDSTALLHATAHAARALGLQVHALHVHHGLVAQADDWQRRLQAQCRRWAAAGLPVAFHTTRLRGAPAAGESIEAWARRHRYRALAEMAKSAGCTLVLLAHHRRDQAETLLLQALRGGGPAGLAAMPRNAQRDGLTWARPWLTQPREAIEAYVRRHRLRYSDDASNDDPRFARNRLRSAVWPALLSAFPDVETQLAAAALRAQEAAAALAEITQGDLAAAVEGAALAVDRWTALGAARRTLLLRAWLRNVLPGPVPESLVRRLAAELPGAQGARWPAPGGELRQHVQRLAFAPTEATPMDAPIAPMVTTVDLSRPGRHPCAHWNGTLVVTRSTAGGIVPERLRAVTLRARSGGEQFQVRPDAPARALKKQYQACRIPAWERGGPLLFDGGALLFACGLGVDARCAAAPGVPQLSLRWEPDASGPRQPAG